MLIEISSDKFQSDGVQRPPIRFTEGLNTVLGGTSGDNSIGKSTFLQIIDFVFGGHTYAKSDAAKEIGPHNINFAFRFEDGDHYFSRRTSTPNIVKICDSNYNSTKETLKLAEFNNFLLRSYKMELPAITFRGAVGLYFRMQGKSNLSTSRPLSAMGSEKIHDTIIRLEKLFNVYSKIEEYEKALKLASDKKDAYRKARSLELISNDVNNKTKYKDNIKEISLLQEELSKLTLESDKDISTTNSSAIDVVSQLKSQIDLLRRKQSKLKSQLEVVKINVGGTSVLGDADLMEFARFFPNANLKHLAEIENFHHKIVKILDSELMDEQDNLNEMIRLVSEEINQAEDKIRSLGMPANIPSSFLEKMRVLSTKISDLEKQNKAFDKVAELKQELDEATKALKEIRGDYLKDIQAEINQELTRLNDEFQGNKLAPVLTFKTDANYDYSTPKDEGTGTAWKALILFDLAMLRLTLLPAIAHDSLMIKNIEAAGGDSIIKLYSKSSKQIFIAIDEIERYNEESQSILENSTVLHLGTNKNELFGYQWGKQELRD